MTFDYLVVGQGLAGTVLAHTLRRAGRSVGVIDPQRLPAASAAAAGLCNPITGAKWVKTWQADALFPYLFDFYAQAERELGVRFFYPLPLYRLFGSVAEQNHALAVSDSPAGRAYLANPPLPADLAGYVRHEHGGLLTRHAAHLDVPALLAAFRRALAQTNCLINEDFTHQDLVVNHDGVTWRGHRARRLVFCEGIHATANHYFNWLPLRPMKGEALVIDVDGPPRAYACKRGALLLPLPNGTCWSGATYNPRDPTWEPTAAARQQLTSQLDATLLAGYRVVGQPAGIRPATPDRRPLVGLHPRHPAVGIFNGLGSKGASLAPYFAHQFCQHLEQDKELPPEIHINRYYPLPYNFP